MEPRERGLQACLIRICTASSAASRGHAHPTSTQACHDTLPVIAQVLALNNERFMVPEVLFQPTDVGLQQAGLPQAIVEAVQATAPNLHPLLYSNVLCTGGCATCPGFRERLYSELRALVPDDCEVGGPPQVTKALCIECMARLSQETCQEGCPVATNSRSHWSCLIRDLMALRGCGPCHVVFVPVCGCSQQSCPCQ